jgi:F-box protein 9
MQPAQSSEPPSQELDELARFREAWKAEVQRKKAEIATQGSTRQEPIQQPKPSSEGIAGVATTGSSLNDRSVLARPTGLSNPAVELYRQAVQYEQRSQLDVALKLYRQVCNCCTS